MDHVGLLARSAEDCATLTTALAGYDRSDRLSAIEADSTTPLRPLSANLNGVRVGVADSFFSDDVDASVASAVHAAVETLLRHGAVARPVSLSGIMEDVTHALAILKVEASYVHDRDLAEHADDLVGDVRVKLQEGSRISGVEYLHALDARSRVRKRLAEAFDDIDGLVGPTCDTTAPLMADDGRVLEPAPYLVAGRPSARIPFNLTGNPAISVPCGYDELGLPVGLQIVGRPWNDWMALSVAHAFQSITDWHLQAPPLSNPARAHLSAALSESVDPTSSDAF
jgi:aspartyl-tRNA(Asn)/glutamyl-tRNA(Gln) amidotransferase subunit A